ncbi:hypothetical protein BKA69DRAFT_1093917 [Paraphysoderma sedebokerense]|nr:hypothetical protein BKA69DRAFT_1093917 [Paraphysoderma sedebokerense]
MNPQPQNMDLKKPESSVASHARPSTTEVVNLAQNSKDLPERSSSEKWQGGQQQVTPPGSQQPIVGQLQNEWAQQQGQGHGEQKMSKSESQSLQSGFEGKKSSREEQDKDMDAEHEVSG